jgi:hypothetical protein
MTVFANLIAHISHVHLEDFNLGRFQGVMSNGLDLFPKRRQLAGLEDTIFKNVYLTLAVSELVMSCVKRLYHGISLD